MNPAELKYSRDHSWVRIKGKVAVMGITDYAQRKLGEILAVELPAVGARVEQLEELGSVDCMKTATTVHSPVSGEVVKVNEDLVDDPQLINRDPYGNGWLVELELDNPDEAGSLMDAAEYEGFVEQSEGYKTVK